MQDGTQAAPAWTHGDTGAGLALHSDEDGRFLRLYVGGQQADLPLTPDALASLGAALGVPRAPGRVATKGPPGPACDRCKAITVQVRDGYRCDNCGNEIMWL